VNPDIFRQYDIRGVVDVDLTGPVVHDLGRALGTCARQSGAATFAVGRDCRTHSPAMWKALVTGLVSTGLEVVDLGVVPTPLLYFGVVTLELGGGVMITGSHNPPPFNGFKMMIGGDTIHGDAIQALRRMMETEAFGVCGSGTVSRFNVVDRYVDFVAADVRRGGRRLKVVVDAGNGVGAIAALPLLERLNVEVVPLFFEPDGTFPNHHPDPSELETLETLIATVRREGADLGIAYDGDADRIGVVDDRGEVVFGDHLLCLLARDVLADSPGATIIGEVKCSQTLFDDIAAHGGVPMMWKVGHSLIKARMKETGAALAGEMSGHIFFAHRYLGFDDAIYTTARLLELLAHQPLPLSRLLETVPRLHATPELRVEVGEREKFAIARAVAEVFAVDHEVVTIDGVRVLFDDGWGLIRASNTQPVLVLRAEGTTVERRDAIVALLYEAVGQAQRTVRG